MHCGHARGFRSDRPRDWGAGLETPSARQRSRHPEGRVAAHGASAAASWWPETPNPSCSGLHNRCEAHRRIGCMAAAAHAAHEAWAHLDGRLAELFATARLELRALLSGPVDGPRCVGPLGHDLFRLRGHGRAIRRLRLFRVTFRDYKESLCNVLSRQPHLPTMTAPSRSPN